MSDSSRYNSPSRRSRFRSQIRGRPAGYPGEPGEESGADGTPAEIAASEEAAALHEDEPMAYELGDDGLAQADDEAREATGHDLANTDENYIPAGLRLTRSSDSFPPVQRGVRMGLIMLAVAGAAVLGGLAGYLLGGSNGKPVVARVDPAKNTVPNVLGGDTQTAVETAFEDTKQGKYADARKAFEALYAKHPEWASMEIEAARAALYQRDYDSVQQLLTKATKDRPLADAAFLLALLHLTAQEFDTANTSFAAAAATDPARGDIYYFWGENLRRQGKPLEAASKFKAALMRNQYENVESLYQMKYWLSLIQADQDGPSGEGAKIDTSLASAYPTSAALFAGAARAIKAGNYKAAAGFISKAQAITDPPVFRVILNDPTFQEANMRPELAGFYK